MRELQGARDLWRLVKELPVNVFDEYAREDVTQRPTVCYVTVKPVDGRRAVRVAVEDDGQGFQHLEDAFTLFRSTPKRGQPQVAGRFNLGEKEIMALALEGRIETTSGTVEFPRGGGRKVNKWRKREVGTLVELVLPAKRDEIDACIKMLKRLIPPVGLGLYVNGERVRAPREVARARATLNTVIQERPGEPLKSAYRTTDIIVHEPSPEGAWLYELGCPVQRIEAPYSADVRQKVPMPPERDTVSNYYLQDIYSAVLNATIGLLGADDVAEDWVKQALEDASTERDAVERAIRLRHGSKVMLWSSNLSANEEAIEAGYAVVSKTALSGAEREAYKRAGVQHASDAFGYKPVSADDIEPDADMRRVADYARTLSEQLMDVALSVRFHRLRRSKYAATYRQTDAYTGCLDFNLANLPGDFFRKITEDVTDLILHELAHHGPDGEYLPHGYAYVHRLSRLGAVLFHVMTDGCSEPALEISAHVKWSDQRGRKDKKDA
jgi:hypothetical protein